MPDEPLRRNAIRPAKERVEDELLQLPGVRGVDINEKTVGGKPTGELSIVVYVEEKKPKSDLDDDEVIPEEIEGIPTDVQEEKIELQPASLGLDRYVAVTDLEPQIDTAQYTPLRGGISMGPCRSVYLEPPDVPEPGNYIFTGTFGAVVEDRSTGKRMALTNFHVACVDDTWSAGDVMAQPSRVDGGSCPADRFGTLTRAVLSENVDGAVVAIDSAEDSDCTIEEIGPVKGIVGASIGMAVRKRGRTTELTYGTVDSTDVTLSIDYGDGLGVQTLKKQIRVVPDTAKNPRFSDKGDSGSVVVDGNNKVLGLLFAGTSSGSATFLNPIQKALDELDVDMCVKSTIITTLPIICKPAVTKPIVCMITKPIACQVVTKPSLCKILTAPKACPVRTVAACPPKTLACPPKTYACVTRTKGCGFTPRRPGTEQPPTDFDPSEVYGRPDAEDIDDAFWLGYYTALEAVSEAEEAESEEAEPRWGSSTGSGV